MKTSTKNPPNQINLHFLFQDLLRYCLDPHKILIFFQLVHLQIELPLKGQSNVYWYIVIDYHNEQNKFR